MICDVDNVIITFMILSPQMTIAFAHQRLTVIVNGLRKGSLMYRVIAAIWLAHNERESPRLSLVH